MSTYRLGGPLHVWSPTPPEDLDRMLPRYARAVSPGRFVVSARVTPNDWMPRLLGIYERADGGTYLRIEPHLPVATILLGVVLSMLLGPLGIVVLVLMGRKQWQEDQVTRDELVAALGEVERGAAALARRDATPRADPTSVDATAAAPPAFHVRTHFDGAAFHLASGPVQVSQQGLRLSDGRRIDWIAVDRVDLRERSVVLEGPENPVQIDVSAHEADDRVWLAAYLDACRARWSPDRSDDARQRARLARLARDRTT